MLVVALVAYHHKIWLHCGECSRAKGVKPGFTLKTILLSRWQYLWYLAYGKIKVHLLKGLVEAIGVVLLATQYFGNFLHICLRF